MTSLTLTCHHQFTSTLLDLDHQAAAHQASTHRCRPTNLGQVVDGTASTEENALRSLEYGKALASPSETSMIFETDRVPSTQGPITCEASAEHGTEDQRFDGHSHEWSVLALRDFELEPSPVAFDSD